MIALVTGSSGFIGSYLVAELKLNGYDVIKCDINPLEDSVKLDILNSDCVGRVIRKFHPDVIFNMAGQANVGLSWTQPQLTVQLNTIGIINILEAVKNSKKETRVITIGSADEYGVLKQRGKNVTEDMQIIPITPYAISKYAQELFSDIYVRSYGLDICKVRLFNLGGAGQAKGFMISDFASGIAEIEKGKRDFLSVGNLDSARDFTHVKDACSALRLIAEKGQSGEVYNVCSGVTHTAKEVLYKLIALSNTNIEIRQDPSKIRPSDTPVIRGNHNKLTEHTGWLPKYELDYILKDVLLYWRACDIN